MLHNRYAPLSLNTNNCIQNKTTKTNNRTDAFNILSDKFKLKDTLKKTKMCNKPNCNKIGCNYAHSKSELQVRKCLFGNECIYKNSSNKMCKYLHPDETMEMYNKRLNDNNGIKKIIL